MLALVSKSALPEPFDKGLRNERIYIYRRDYQRFRRGEAEGAVGETNQFNTDFEGYENIPDLDPDALKKETFYSIESKNIRDVYEAITKYRISYARFRQGSHKGAKGEVSAVTSFMTMNHAKFMPVGQLAHVIQMKKSEEAAGGFEAAYRRPRSKLHVHFGGGKLGLGLLSPAIAKAYKDEKIAYCLVDAPFGDYKELVDRGVKTVNFYVNGEPSITDLTLVTKREQLDPYIVEWSSTTPDSRLFICSTDSDLVSIAVSAATTISTSLGPILPKVIMPHFQKDVVPELRKTIYSCENDHGMVDKLAEDLEGKAYVVTCMVDRICTDRVIDDASDPNKNNNVYVTAEPHTGDVVILNPPQGLPLPAFRGPNIAVPQSQGEANYFCKRKIGIVNGMHTTLAFMTLCKQQPPGDDIAGDHKLMTNKDASEEEKQIIWTWCVGRLLLILYEHDIEVIKHAHSVQSDEQVVDILLNYGKLTLNRFDSIVDQTSRVLGGGVANRWNTRLRTVQNYLNSVKRLNKGIENKLLKKAGVKESTLRSCVDKLVADSERFVGNKPTWAS